MTRKTKLWDEKRKSKEIQSPFLPPKHLDNTGTSQSDLLQQVLEKQPTETSVLKRMSFMFQQKNPLENEKGESQVQHQAIMKRSASFSVSRGMNSQLSAYF